VLEPADGPSNFEKNTLVGKHTHRKRDRHPASAELAAFVDKKVSVAERELLIEHLAECAVCRKLVARVVASTKAVRGPQKHRS